MYDYRKAVEADIMDYIQNEINLDDFSSREELEEKLNDDLFVEDSVTGNASGSYTFNRYEAEEFVTDNFKLCIEACEEFGVDSYEFSEKFYNEDYEYFDVAIRCYLLGDAISKALDDLWTND